MAFSLPDLVVLRLTYLKEKKLSYFLTKGFFNSSLDKQSEITILLVAENEKNGNFAFDLHY